MCCHELRIFRERKKRARETGLKTSENSYDRDLPSSIPRIDVQGGGGKGVITPPNEFGVAVGPPKYFFILPPPH